MVREHFLFSDGQTHAIGICLWSVTGPDTLVWNLRNVSFSLFLCHWELHDTIDQIGRASCRERV